MGEDFSSEIILSESQGQCVLSKWSGQAWNLALTWLVLLGQLSGKQDSMMQSSVDLTSHNIFVSAKPGQYSWNIHIQSSQLPKEPEQ